MQGLQLAFVCQSPTKQQTASFSPGSALPLGKDPQSWKVNTSKPQDSSRGHLKALEGHWQAQLCSAVLCFGRRQRHQALESLCRGYLGTDSRNREFSAPQHPGPSSSLAHPACGSSCMALLEAGGILPSCPLQLLQFLHFPRVLDSFVFLVG